MWTRTICRIGVEGSRVLSDRSRGSTPIVPLLMETRAPHSHQGDPTIVYVLEGVLTNHHDDGTTEESRPGQVFAEFGPRSHWVENKGPAPVTFIAANIHR